MSSLLDLLTQNQPQFQTHQALLVLGLQNDFVSPNGKLPVSTKSGFLNRITQLVPVFRENAGDIIWVKTVFDQERTVNDGSDDAEMVIVDNDEAAAASAEDSGEETIAKEMVSSSLRARSSRSTKRAFELFKRVSSSRKQVPVVQQVAPPAPGEDELFLSRTSKRGPCCLPNSPGAEFADAVKSCIDTSRDTVVTKSHYSAFRSTSLLLHLRAKLITELYICGCGTNMSVYATALDAARHGLTINVVEDCLGYRKLARHEEALKQLTEIMGAFTVTSTEMVKDLQSPPEKGRTDVTETSGLSDMVEQMTLNNKPEPSKREDDHKVDAPEPFPKFNETDDVFEEETAAVRPKSSRTGALGDRSERDLIEHLTSGATRPPRDSASVAKPPKATDDKEPYVKAKVRMRPRKGKSKKKGAEEESGKEMPVVAEPPADNSAKESHLPSSRHVLNVAKVDRKASEPSISKATLKPPTSLRESRSTPEMLNASQDHSSPVPTARSPLTTSPPMLGPDDMIGEGDSRIVFDLLPQSLADSIFHSLYNEVRWQKMYHAQGEVPRLVCVQGEFGRDGSMPVYRHPSDQSLPLLHFSPAVQKIRKHVQKIVKHPVNHVLIQLYRSGHDYISEHSDKTLDIVRGSSIVNVSFGAQRTMRLRTKKSAKKLQGAEDTTERQTQRIPMPHNSMFVLGQETNMRWLHGINMDKRAANERSEAEKAYSGMRISLTFRHIGTFLNKDSTRIWGQGATAKEIGDAKKVINNDATKTQQIINAFGKENQSTDFDWDATHGAGFDVLHFRTPPKDVPILFPTHDSVVTQQVSMYLSEVGLEHVVEDLPPADQNFDRGREIYFRDTDAHHTEVLGVMPILLYLDRYHPLDKSDMANAASASAYPLLFRLAQRAGEAKPTIEVHDSLESTKESQICDMEGHSTSHTKEKPQVHLKLQDLLTFEESLDDLRHDGFIAGPRFSVADCAFWPVLNEVVERSPVWDREKFPSLAAYHGRLRGRKSIARLLDGDATEQSP